MIQKTCLISFRVVWQLLDRENLIFNFISALYNSRKMCSVFEVHGKTNLSLWFQFKNRVWKICNESTDIQQNVPKFRLPNKTFILLNVLVNISGPGAYFSKPILRWNRQLKLVVLSTMNPINGTIFFLSYKRPI